MVQLNGILRAILNCSDAMFNNEDVFSNNFA